MQQKSAREPESTATASATNKSGNKRSSPKSSSSDDSDVLDTFDTSSYEPATLTPAPKRKKVIRKVTKKVIEIYSVDVDVFDDDGDSSPVAPKPRSRPTRGRKPIKYINDSDDDGGDSDDNGGDSDDDFDFNE